MLVDVFDFGVLFVDDDNCFVKFIINLLELLVNLTLLNNQIQDEGNIFSCLIKIEQASQLNGNKFDYQMIFLEIAIAETCICSTRNAIQMKYEHYNSVILYVVKHKCIHNYN